MPKETPVESIDLDPPSPPAGKAASQGSPGTTVAADDDAVTVNGEEVSLPARAPPGAKRKRVKFDSGDVYTGYMLDGHREGWGTYSYANGSKYVGLWKADLRHGRGTMTLKNGNKYSGEYVAGLRHGQGKESTDKWTYEGKFHEDKKTGHGVLRRSDGTVYEGDFEDDLPHGHGRFKFGPKTKWRGDVYDGAFEKGSFHGQGVYRHANGDVFEGEYDHDVRMGKGRIQYASGDLFEGEFQDGARHGPTCMFASADGSVYKGPFEHDEIGGTGTIELANGNVYTGMLSKGLPAGVGKMLFLEQGSAQFSDVYDGEWFDGQMHGAGTYTHGKDSPLAGDVYKGQYENGQRTGTGLYKSERDKHLYEGEFVDGLKHGQGKYTWLDTGATYNGGWKTDLFEGVGHYRNRRRNGDKISGTWESGLPQGTMEILYSGAGTAQKSEWVNGQPRKTFSAGVGVEKTHNFKLPTVASYVKHKHILNSSSIKMVGVGGEDVRVTLIDEALASSNAVPEDLVVNTAFLKAVQEDQRGGKKRRGSFLGGSLRRSSSSGSIRKGRRESCLVQ